MRSAAVHPLHRKTCNEADMTFIAKPKVAHPSLPKNALGLHPPRLRGLAVDAVRRLRP